MMTILSDDTDVAAKDQQAGADAPVSVSSAPKEPSTESILQTPLTLMLDVGPRRIKSLVVDQHGTPSGKCERLKIDQPVTPDAVLAAMKRVIPDTTFSRIAVCVPGAVRQGVLQASSGLGRAVAGIDLQRELGQRSDRPVCVRSHAEWLGLNWTQRTGTEVVVTLGKTVGIAFFFDGTPVSDFDLAQHPLWKSKTYQQCMGRSARKRLGRKKWSRLVRRALTVIQATFQPQRIYLSGRDAAAVKGTLPAGVERKDNEDQQALRGVVTAWCSDSLPTERIDDAAPQYETSKMSNM